MIGEYSGHGYRWLLSALMASVADAGGSAG